MCENGNPTGQRFSLVHLRRDELLRDNDRLRFRLARLFRSFLNTTSAIELGRVLESELGIPVVTNPPYNQPYVDWETFLGRAEIADLLDCVTLCWRHLQQSSGQRGAVGYLSEVRRILLENQVGYSVDDEGGVHPALDLAFESNRVSLLHGLGPERYSAVRDHIEAVERALLNNPVDGRQAIRSVFDAVENLFKQMFPGVTHVTTSNIRDRLKPLVEQVYSDRQVARRSALKQMESFVSWVEGAHFYRHAEGQPEPQQPPETLTTLTVSQGFGFVRWLAALENS